MATELAKAYVQIVPSAQGIQGAISDVMNGEANSAGEKSGKSLASSLGGALKKGIIGLGVGKMIADGIGSASEFETGMAKVSTLFSGSAEEFGQLKEDILGLSSAYGIGAQELTEAAYSAESAGVKQEDLIYMLEHSAELAKAGFTDLDTALSATAKTMNAYGKDPAAADLRCRQSTDFYEACTAGQPLCDRERHEGQYRPFLGGRHHRGISRLQSGSRLSDRVWIAGVQDGSCYGLRTDPGRVCIDHASCNRDVGALCPPPL